MRLKVGDKVRIRKDLSEDLECKNGVTPTMVDLAGREATITSVAYGLDIGKSYCAWDLEMFEPMKEAPTKTSSQQKPLTFHISWLESAIEKMKEQNVLSSISGDMTVEQIIEKYLADDLKQVINLD